MEGGRPTPFNPREHLIPLRNRGGSSEYLPVAWRLVWLRDEHPDAAIESEKVEGGIESNYAVFKARVSIPGGGSATGWGSETKADFGDFLEKAETKAIGRALAALGYGTQFAPDLDEGDRIADSPVERGRRGGGRQEGRADQAAAQEPGEATLSWTPFWAWAKDRGLKTRDDLDRAAGAATIGMVPAEIKAAILARAPGGEKRPLTADETLEWLGAQDRPLKAQEKGCAHLFSLTDDQAELDAYRALALSLAHQDAVDGAWFDRMTDLGRPTTAVPAVEDGPDGGALQGDVPGDEHPDDVPFK